MVQSHTSMDKLYDFTNSIDELTYEYDGNRLTKVTDAPNANRHFGFVDGTNTNNDYEYDLFGNMIADRNKGITQIRYNHLNLPIQILFANGSSIMYHYNAIGIKFYKFVQNTSTSTFFDVQYIGGFQYQNAKLNFIHIPQGYVNVLKPTASPENRVYDYIYQYKDHLGNVRLSYSFDRDRQEIRTLTEHNYYPFGLEHSYLQTRRRPELVDSPTLDGIIAEPVGLESRTSQMVQVDDVRYLYKYNTKEYQDELGQNVYAYGWRDYDPAIGRFNKMDKFSEKYYKMTPYGYAGNNPVLINDIQGDSLWISFGNKN